MGWRPDVRWDKHNRRWYCHLNGKNINLGRNELRARQRFERLVGSRDAPCEIEYVADAIAAWLREHPGRWRADMLASFGEFAGDRRLQELRPDCLVRYVRKLQHLSPQTVRHKYAIAARVLAWVRRQGLASVEPEKPKLVPPPRNPRGLDAETLVAVFAGLKGPRIKRVLEFILVTSCRPGDARQLRWSQVMVDRRICVLPPSEHKTGHHHGRSRTIYLASPRALELLDEAGEQDGRDGYVFLSRLGKPYTISGLRSPLRQFGVTPYQLRHSYAQLALDAGMGIEDLAEIMGHSDLRMVKHYAEVRSSRALAAAQRVEMPAVQPVPAPPTGEGGAASARGSQSGPKHSRRKSTKGRACASA